MSSIKIIYLTTILTICSLYAAQPIQPVFQVEFGLTELQATLFTTLIMAPLGLAPLLYGFFLEAHSIKKLVRIAILVMGVLEICFSFTNSYMMLLVIRGAQGLVIPAILTSLMSYISYTCVKENVQHSIALYIGATIMGGFLGRFFSGLLTDLFGWRFFFFILGVLFLAIYSSLGKLQDHAKLQYATPNLAAVVGLLKKGKFFWLYLCIFCVFFVFAALMNFLPFELMKLRPEYGGAGIGFLYVGYSMGVLVALANKRIRSFFSHEAIAITVGIGVYFVGTAIFLAESYWVMFFGMFVFCTGMFMIHSLLSGFVNTLTSSDNKAIANGLYISFYYTGGTIGSFVPGILIKHFSWSVFIYSLLVVICFALFCNWKMKASL